MLIFVDSQYFVTHVLQLDPLSIILTYIFSTLSSVILNFFLLSCRDFSSIFEGRSTLYSEKNFIKTLFHALWNQYFVVSNRVKTYYNIPNWSISSSSESTWWGSTCIKTAVRTNCLCFLFFFNSFFLACFPMEQKKCKNLHITSSQSLHQNCKYLRAWSVGFIYFPLLVVLIDLIPIFLKPFTIYTIRLSGSIFLTSNKEISGILIVDYQLTWR